MSFFPQPQQRLTHFLSSFTGSGILPERPLFNYFAAIYQEPKRWLFVFVVLNGVSEFILGNDKFQNYYCLRLLLLGLHPTLQVTFGP